MSSKVPDAPWLHLLSEDQKAWREKQILKGRDPDSYIEQRLRESGDWPEVDNGTTSVSRKTSVEKR